MLARRSRHRLVAAGRYLYAIGGRDADGQSLSSVERYDPRTNNWRAIAAMNQARTLPGVVALQRGPELFIAAVGGVNLSGPDPIFLRSSEIHRVNTGRWRSLPELLPDGRASLVSAEESSGAILTIGGGTPTPTAFHTPTRLYWLSPSPAPTYGNHRSSPTRAGTPVAAGLYGV